MIVVRTRRLSRGWLPMIVPWAFAIMVGALIARPPPMGPLGFLAIGIALVVGVCLLPIAIWHVSPLSPGLLYALATLAGVGMGAVAWFGEPYAALPISNREWVGRALLLVAAGMTAFWLGYRLTRPPADAPRFKPSRSVPLTIVWSLFAIGLAANVVLFQSGRFAYLATASTEGLAWVQWAVTGAGLMGIAINIAAIHAFGNDSALHRRALFIMLAISTGVGVVSGMKSSIFWPLAWTMFIYFFFRRRLPWKPIAAILLGALVLVPANFSYRTTLRSTGAVDASSPDSVISAAVRTLADSWNATPGDRIALLGQWTSVRFRNIDSVAAIMRLTPSTYPYVGGRLYAQVPLIVVVPRAVWPEKPILDLGYQFGQKYFGRPASIRTSTPITNQGDLYMQFGPWGVVVGMCLWGVAAASLFRWFSLRGSPQALLMYVAALSAFVAIETDFVSLAAVSFRNLLLTLLVARLAYGPLRSRDHHVMVAAKY